MFSFTRSTLVLPWNIASAMFAWNAWNLPVKLCSSCSFVKFEENISETIKQHLHNHIFTFICHTFAIKGANKINGYATYILLHLNFTYNWMETEFVTEDDCHIDYIHAV